jgi:hypothetical protein
MRSAVVATALVMMLYGSAQATTRDDVLAGMVRCGAIVDDRIWLNCVYGAAQPMRSQLGLLPAPASQVNLVPAVPAAPSRITGVAVSVTSEPKESCGFFSYVFGGEAVITNMQLASYRFDSQGLFTVTLVNGQVWEQREGGSELAHWRGPASQYIASIRKGAIGSFDLVIAHEGTHYKVRRIQ